MPFDKNRANEISEALHWPEKFKPLKNNSDYFRAHLESDARYKEHAHHITEFAVICKMLIEETVPILIEQYMAGRKQSVIFDVKTYLNGKIVDFKTELSNACARVFQKFMR